MTVTLDLLIRPLLIAGLVVAFATEGDLLAGAAGQGGSQWLTREQSLKACTDAVRRVNAYLEAQGIEPKVTVSTDLPFSYEYDSMLHEEVAVLGNGRSPVEVTFTANGGRIVLFDNWAAFNAAFGDNPRLYKEKPEPKWPEQKAVAVAEGYVRALLGEFPSSMKFAKAQYDWLGRRMPEYYEGEWSVSWVRTNSQGVVFSDDRVVVKVLEDFGPTSVFVLNNSEYDHKDFKPIPREPAIEKALPAAKEIMNCPAAKEWFAGLSITGTPSAELKIVNPNHITQAKTLEEAAHGDRKARLAWVVTYETKYAGPPQAGPVPAPGNVQVWIDAETGEFLGGDGK